MLQGFRMYIHGKTYESPEARVKHKSNAQLRHASTAVHHVDKPQKLNPDHTYLQWFWTGLLPQMASCWLAVSVCCL